MSALIREGDRQCDERCYFAEGDSCDCICGGHFHGAGTRGELARAIESCPEDLLEGLEHCGADTEALRRLRASDSGRAFFVLTTRPQGRGSLFADEDIALSGRGTQKGDTRHDVAL